jgi:hypothetical protein
VRNAGQCLCIFDFDDTIRLSQGNSTVFSRQTGVYLCALDSVDGGVVYVNKCCIGGFELYVPALMMSLCLHHWLTLLENNVLWVYFQGQWHQTSLQFTTLA